MMAKIAKGHPYTFNDDGAPMLQQEEVEISKESQLVNVQASLQRLPKKKGKAQADLDMSSFVKQQLGIELLTIRLQRAPDSSMKSRPKHVETREAFHDPEKMTADNLTQGVNLHRGTAHVLKGRSENRLNPPIIDSETGEVLYSNSPRAQEPKTQMSLDEYKKVKEKVLRYPPASIAIDGRQNRADHSELVLRDDNLVRVSQLFPSAQPSTTQQRQRPGKNRVEVNQSAIHLLPCSPPQGLSRSFIFSESLSASVQKKERVKSAVAGNRGRKTAVANSVVLSPTLNKVLVYSNESHLTRPFSTIDDHHSSKNDLFNRRLKEVGAGSKAIETEIEEIVGVKSPVATSPSLMRIRRELKPHPRTATTRYLSL